MTTPNSCYNKGPHHFHDSSKLKDVKMKGIAWLFEVKLEGREGVATKSTINMKLVVTVVKNKETTNSINRNALYLRVY